MGPRPHRPDLGLQTHTANSTPQVSNHGAVGSPTTVHSSSQPGTRAPSVSQPAEPNAAATPASSKKPKAKKGADPLETSKLLAAKISQLESDRAGERDQENEVEREVKRATRDLSSLLANIESPLSRLEALQKKYADLLGDLKRMEQNYQRSKRRAEQLQKERDHGRSELSKTITLKEKLEKLCRELQKDNKKEDHKHLEASEKKKREHLNQLVDGILSDVQDVISKREDPEAQKVNMEVEELFKQKFKSFIDQYELREIHLHSVLRWKELEVQCSLAQVEQHKKVAEQESARSRALSAQVTTFSQTETELRSQLNIYVEKFKQVCTLAVVQAGTQLDALQGNGVPQRPGESSRPQASTRCASRLRASAVADTDMRLSDGGPQVEDTLNNSNDLFLTFRKEMEDMSKKTKRLEKDNLNLSRKHDMTNRNIIEMAEERTRLSEEMDQLRKKNESLEKLCRGMQAQGRGHGIVGGGAVGATAVERERQRERDRANGGPVGPATAVGGGGGGRDGGRLPSQEDGYDPDDLDAHHPHHHPLNPRHNHHHLHHPHPPPPPHQHPPVSHPANGPLPKFGPAPPPPANSPTSQNPPNGVSNGLVNGSKH
ncbi:MAG: hypothetical protein M1826_001702 [Phylliscum demangeonii]|nr:MAG: hypothetical protein M1826_001702 [Phylliscum demangeonii]